MNRTLSSRLVCAALAALLALWLPLSPALAAEPEPSFSPAPSASPFTSDTPEPSAPPGPTDTPEPSESPEPADTPEPAESPGPSATPLPPDAVFAITYFDYDGSPLEYNGPTSYAPGSPDIVLPRPERQDRLFAGWTGADLPGQTLDVTIPSGSAGDRAYTAHWYTVGGVPNGVYSGRPVVPAVSVWQDDVLLSKGADYTLTGGSNVDAGTAALTIAGTEARPGLYAVRSFIIRPAPVVVGGITALDKPYDGTTEAQIDTEHASLSGVMPGDELRVTASGAFLGPSAGERRVVLLSDLTLVGPRSYNYTLDESGRQRIAVAAIYPAQLSQVYAGQRGTMTDRTVGHRPAVTVSAQTVDGSPVLFTFAASPDGPYGPLPPVFREPGKYTVWYRAEALNHERAEGTFPVTVEVGTAPSSIGLYTPLTRAASGTYSIDLTLSPDREDERVLSLTVTPKGARERRSVLTLSLTDRPGSVPRTRLLREGEDWESRYLFDGQGNLLLAAALLTGEPEGTLVVEFDLPEYRVTWYPGWRWTSSPAGERPTADEDGAPLRFYSVKINNHLQDRASFRLGLNGEEILLEVDDGGTASALTTAAEPRITVSMTAPAEGEPVLSVTGALSPSERADELREDTDYFLRAEGEASLLTFVGSWRSAVTLSPGISEGSG